MSEESADISTLVALLGHKKHARHWDTRVDEIQALLDSGADPDGGPVPPLLWAARIGHLEIARLLLDAGADPNAVATASYGISPIHEVCRGHETGGSGEVRLLHERGAGLDATDRGGVSALHMAVRDRNVETVRSLLELGASVDIEDRGRRSTPLRRAVATTGRSGTTGKGPEAREIVRLLLPFGADPDHVNRTGRPVVASATNAEIRRLLRRRG